MSGRRPSDRGASSSSSTARRATGGGRVPNSLEEVSRQMVTLGSKIKSIQTSSSYLGTVKETPQMRQRLTRERQEAEDLAHSIGEAFKMLKPRAGDEDLKYKKLLLQFKNDFETLRTVVKDSIRKERLSEGQDGGAESSRSRRGGRGATRGGVPEGDERQSLSALQQEQVQDRRFDKTSIVTTQAIEEERLRELEGLEQDLEDLGEIFVDLNNMVQDQGTMVSTFSQNINKADAHVSTGVVNLDKAREYQKKSRKKMCCIILFIAIGVAVVLAFGLGFGLK